MVAVVPWLPTGTALQDQYNTQGVGDMQHESTYLSDGERQRFASIVTSARRDERFTLTAEPSWPAREETVVHNCSDLFGPDAHKTIVAAAEKHTMTANAWGLSTAPFGALVNHIAQAGADNG